MPRASALSNSKNRCRCWGCGGGLSHCGGVQYFFLHQSCEHGVQDACLFLLGFRLARLRLLDMIQRGIDLVESSIDTTHVFLHRHINTFVHAVQNARSMGCSILGRGAEPLVRTQFLEHPPTLNFGASQLQKWIQHPQKPPIPFLSPHNPHCRGGFWGGVKELEHSWNRVRTQLEHLALTSYRASYRAITQLSRSYRV